ncbi:MAG: hypothetical protein D6748_08395, partial [Calditrichaeota bacterium]
MGVIAQNEVGQPQEAVVDLALQVVLFGFGGGMEPGARERKLFDHEVVAAGGEREVHHHLFGVGHAEGV